MSVISSRRLGLRALLACALAPTAARGPALAGAGADLIWVPTPERAVVRMLELAGVGPDDLVVDLGSGDGRIPIAAARLHGARGLGIELDPGLVGRARALAARAGVDDRVRFVEGDLFEADLAGATVVTLYLLPDLNLRLRPRLLALPPGTRILAHAFDLGDWDADAEDRADGAVLRMWRVPARVAGTWHWDHPGPAGVRPAALALSQRHQQVQGVLDLAGRRMRLREAALSGARLRMLAVEPTNAGPARRHEIVACVHGDTLEGHWTTVGARPATWRATRAPVAPRRTEPATPTSARPARAGRAPSRTTETGRTRWLRTWTS